MKKILILLCLGAGLLSPLLGKSEERKPRIPPLAIENAVKLVYEHHNKTQALKPVFVDEAAFVRKEGKGYWRIGVRYEKHETGLLVYTVSSEGTVEIDSVVKDG